ncbi:MAG TPA: hypothetical protein VFL63_05250 [Rhodanobacteraceae bacterium]|nr:hypothetical protein [Rhodanobacteraceae bacterium]
MNMPPLAAPHSTRPGAIAIALALGMGASAQAQRAHPDSIDDRNKTARAGAHAHRSLGRVDPLTARTPATADSHDEGLNATATHRKLDE